MERLKMGQSKVKTEHGIKKEIKYLKEEIQGSISDSGQENVDLKNINARKRKLATGTERESKKNTKLKVKQESKIEPSTDFEHEITKIKKRKTSSKRIKLENKNTTISDEENELFNGDMMKDVETNLKKKSQENKLRNTDRREHYWQTYELLSDYQSLDLNISQSIVALFDEGCTIPFIARYRKDVTNNMTPEVLRDVKDNYDKIITLKSRAQTVLNCMRKSENLDANLERTILSARTIEEIEHIYAPFKPGGKRTLAERARVLGLQQPAQEILESSHSVDINKYIDTSNSELDSYEKVKLGIIHIIAHIISTDINVLTFLRRIKMEGNFGIEVKKLNKRATKTKPSTSKLPDESKYENYFDFKISVNLMKPHQVLAVNRGEAQKVLSVKVAVPEFIFQKFTTFCKNRFQYYNNSNDDMRTILDESIQDCYSRLLQPLLIREIRSELKQSAEKASYEVFCSNLKHLLLTPPIKGRAILGIDPGFSNGCKAALISPIGTLLISNVFYLHGQKSGKEAKVLRDMLQLHNCSLIALGNGTACRETETWLSDLISKNYFSPLDVSYIIVNENGASIYSCSPEAKKEFPTLDPNIISAVSLARRIQEPLAEFVKVEPKHLGVGMYQHDLPKKKLEEALDEVVSECVSFVGVDLNVASQCLLRRIAGLSDKRATKIIEYRDSKGPFINRKELMKITGIGSKIFEQCAGFLRVGPLTMNEESSFYKNSNSNKLDCTIIHPESYELTIKLVKLFNLELTNIGTKPFINAIKEKTRSLNFQELSQLFQTSEQTLRLICDALAKPLNYDLRNECSKVRLFKKGITNLSDLKLGSILTGRICNVTHFGSFVDIGVGCDGLIHISKSRGQTLQTGYVVEVRVVNFEIQRKRIGLELIKLI